MWGAFGSYAPTVPELLVALGVVSVGVLAFMILCQKLLPPTKDVEVSKSVEADDAGKPQASAASLS